MESTMDLLPIAGGLVVVVLVLVGILVKLRASSSSSSPAAGSSTGANKDAAASASLPVVTFYYGSQTGTAEKYAKQLARDSAQHGLKGIAMDLENFAASQKPTEAAAAKERLKAGGVAVFLMATYGEGDPTDNAVEFMKWLKEAEHAPDMFRALKFTVFGLGNRQYEHFNKAGKDVNSRLETLGAARIYKHGEGDDDGSLEEDYFAWREGLFPALVAAAGAGANGTVGRSGSTAGSEGGEQHGDGCIKADVAWKVVPLQAAPKASSLLVPGSPAAKQASEAAERASKHFWTSVPCPVVKNVELRQSTGVGASTRHVEIDIKGTGLSYKTADNLYICPENDSGVVAEVARALGFNLDQWFDLQPASSSSSSAPLFPTPCSVRTALTRYCDLVGKVDHDLLHTLAAYATDPAEKQKLLRLCSKEGKPEFHQWSVESQRGIYEVFSGRDSFKSLKMDLATFFAVIPRLQPRAYTIASSSSVQPTTIVVCASVLDAPKPGSTSDGGSDGGRRMRGVCSHTLLRASAPAAQQQQQQLQVYVRPSTFHLPADASTPVIMIGPGTGIAPMRAFLQERQWQRKQNNNNSVGPTVLFFGCRRRDEDYIYAEELQSYCRDGTLTALHTAFSREQQNKKVYVQHLIAEQGAQLWQYISESNAHVYVCGATAMGSDVLKAFTEQVVMAHGKLTHDAAAKYVKSMQEGHRYIQELWSS